MSSRFSRSPTEARCATEAHVSTPAGSCDRRGRPPRRALAALALVGAVACGEGPAASSPHPAAPGTSASGTTAPSQRLTASETALTNLNSRIVGLRTAVSAQPSVAALRAELVANLLSRAQFVGSFSDLSESLVLASEGHSLSSDAERAIETEASALGSVHEFTSATELLASIDRTATDAFGNLQLARGADPRPIEQARRERVQISPSFGSWSSWAIALAAAGDFEAADAAYAAALEHYRDVSPLPVAWVAFQRGVMWAERAGDSARGRAFYAEATRVLPEYVVANVHLAEVEISEGQVDAARSRLGRLVEAGTEDPEPYGVLSSIAATASERERLRELTESRYRSLIERHPNAFLDHGAEFFVTVDPELALELALDNLANRTEDRAYQTALEVALAAGAAEMACELARDATKEAYPGFLRPTVPLRDLARSVLADCE